MPIRLRQLEAFVSIVETGGVTSAADALALTQSSASKLLKSLEESIGFSLFERAGRGLRLTDQGQAFLKHARSTLESFEDVQKAAEDIRNNRRQRLRVCAIGPLSFSALIPQALTEFATENPGFSMSLDNKFRIEIEEWVAQGHADLGFTLLPVSHPALNSRPLSPVRAVAVVPAGHALADRDALKADDLIDQTVIMPHSQARVRALVEASFVSAGYKLNPRIETSNAVSAVYLVSQGAGISVLDPFSCLAVPEADVRLIPWLPDTQMTYGMIWQGNRSLSAWENGFFDAVARNCADHLYGKIPGYSPAKRQ